MKPSSRGNCGNGFNSSVQVSGIIRLRTASAICSLACSFVLNVGIISTTTLITKIREIKYFSCPNTKSERGTCNGTHYIRVDFLEQVVLGEIRRLTKFVSQYETQFAKLMMGFTQQAMATERKQVQLELSKAKARDRELDTLFEKLYEDNVAAR